MQESHHNAFLDIHLDSKKKNFKICFRWRRIWCDWSFDVQSYLKGLWHASAHVRHLDLWSGEPFFKIGFWWENPLPSTLRRPRKLLYQYSWDILSILEVLNAIFCIFVQALWKKFEVIKEKCTNVCYLLSVFLQTDQMCRLMWSFGFQRLATELPSCKTPKWNETKLKVMTLKNFLRKIKWIKNSTASITVQC